MSKEGNVAKTLGALSAIGKVLSFLEKVMIGGFFMLLEFARIKRKEAENRADTAETKLAIKEKHDEIDDEVEQQSSTQIIDNFLADKSDDNGE